MRLSTPNLLPASPSGRAGVRRLLFLSFLLLAALLLRCYELSLPFLKLHEAAFQESLALNHLDFGLLHNHFLSLLADVDSVKYFHVSHPPLLQYILAGAFGLFGVSEAVARLALLPFSLGTIYLTYRIAELELSERIARLAAIFVTFSLLSSYFSRIVNYEVLTQFFALWVFHAYLRHRRDPSPWNLLLVVSVFLLGCMTDWPFYLILPALVVYPLFAPTPEAGRWRQLLLPAGLVIAGFAMVGLYLVYQREITGHMMLLGHGRNRMAGNLLLEPDFYGLLAKRLFRYAPFLCVLAPAGLLVAADRKVRSLLPILPLLFVAIAYVTIFAQAARAHEWTLYYFAVPMAMLSGVALDRLITKRRFLMSAVCLLLIAYLVRSNLAFHANAKNSVFADIYNVSIFMRTHLPVGSTVYSAIYGQVGYYLEDRAEVLYSFAKGDLHRHDYDCYLLDLEAPADPTRRKLFPADGPGPPFEPIVTAARFNLTCRDHLFAGHLLLDEETREHHLIRIGEAVHLSTLVSLAPGEAGYLLPLRGRSLATGNILTFSFGYTQVECPPVELALYLEESNATPVELLRRTFSPEPEAWRDLTVVLGHFADGPASLRWQVDVDEPCGLAYLGDPVLTQVQTVAAPRIVTSTAEER